LLRKWIHVPVQLRVHELAHVDGRDVGILLKQLDEQAHARVVKVFKPRDEEHVERLEEAHRPIVQQHSEQIHELLGCGTRNRIRRARCCTWRARREGGELPLLARTSPTCRAGCNA